MNRAEKELLIECANFIGAYADGSNKATSLVARIDEVLKQDDIPEGWVEIKLPPDIVHEKDSRQLPSMRIHEDEFKS